MKNKRFWKTVWEIFKDGQISFVFMLLMSMTPLLIMTVSNVALRMCLLVLNLAILVLLCFILARSSGEKHYKATVAWEARRRYAEEHGEPDGQSKTELLYKPWKGFAIGFSSNWLMYILLIVWACLPAASREGLEAAIVLVYGVFASITRTISVSSSVLFVLFGALVMCAASGAGYLLGARKQIAIQKKIERRHEEIYGERR